MKREALGFQESNALVIELLRNLIRMDRVVKYSNPKATAFALFSIILMDDGKSTISCSDREILIQELRKDSILWNKVRPYFKNTEEKCKHCKHMNWWHDKITEQSKTGCDKGQCTCQKFVKSAF